MFTVGTGIIRSGRIRKFRSVIFLKGRKMNGEQSHEDKTTDPGAGIAEFAAELRRLRLEAGSPTLAHLRHRTGISRTVISDALSGRSLPTERTVDALVRAFDEDPAPALQRRADLARRATPSGLAAAPVEATESTERPHGFSRRGAVLLSLGTFLAGSLVTLGGVAAVTALTTPPPGAPQIAVENGIDPAATACVEDAAVATGDTRADNSLLEIVWSDKCQAGWGRITRYDGKAMGNTVSIAIYPKTAADGPLRQEATEHDVQGAYTTLVVRPSPDTLLCAEGSFTVDGTRIDLGDPLCI